MDALREGLGHFDGSTGLPAPLFFERVVRDYISDFVLSAEDPAGQDAGDDDDDEE